MTTTTLQKWGNSYAVRLPKALVEKNKLRAGQTIQLRELKDKKISIEPVRENEASLAILAARINEKNKHTSVDWGAPLGNEVW